MLVANGIAAKRYIKYIREGGSFIDELVGIRCSTSAESFKNLSTKIGALNRGTYGKLSNVAEDTAAMKSVLTLVIPHAPTHCFRLSVYTGIWVTHQAQFRRKCLVIPRQFLNKIGRMSTYRLQCRLQSVGESMEQHERGWEEWQ